MAATVLTREQLEQREATMLAPYAALAGNSRGRVYPQAEHPLRTAFQRDRDRVIHCAAFRRLEYKTQVFIPHEQDHFRTRLTHTLEVAQISRTLARSLSLNEDLAEAVALVHDLGHTPFGHAGEDVLDELLSGRGGFNHNGQSLRVVDRLEHRYPEHPGLNLTYEVREGIVKHETSAPIPLVGFGEGQPTLEAALVNFADEIAYNAHDLDDGLASGILLWDTVRDLPGLVPFFSRGGDAIEATDGEYRRYLLTRALINGMVVDVLEESGRRLRQAAVVSLDDVRRSSHKLIAYSNSMAAVVDELKRFLSDHLYKHPRLKGLSDRARIVIETVFEHLRQQPTSLPPRFRQMLSESPPDVVIADFIAGMTDRYAQRFYEQLTGG